MTASLATSAAEAFVAFREGDTARLGELVALLTPPLWAVARSSGLTPAQAEDVVQTAWLALVSKASTIVEPQAVFAWLLTTTKREAWRAARVPATAELSDAVAARAPTPDAVAENHDLSRRLWAHVRQLSPRCQALLRVIAYAAAPDYATISAALGMPVGSIGPTRGRCLATLRRALADDPSWSTA
ncbi:RNA polymerase sigma factor [Tessaracoccus sp. Z1128]